MCIYLWFGSTLEWRKSIICWILRVLLYFCSYLIHFGIANISIEWNDWNMWRLPWLTKDLMVSDLTKVFYNYMYLYQVNLKSLPKHLTSICLSESSVSGHCWQPFVSTHFLIKCHRQSFFIMPIFLFVNLSRSIFLHTFGNANHFQPCISSFSQTLNFQCHTLNYLLEMFIVNLMIIS
jgi:hypothetical protein